MNTAAKLFSAMCAKQTDWRLADLQTVAKRHGITWHLNGSHCVFTFPGGDSLSVPAHRTIKPIYVKRFVAFVKGL